ncbi:MAG: hypothetical protein NUV65_02210 [Candidatus Roizmanbacteria bacterium]|nr:hypothetical protein [Candidatus Roizmanbacteria bacterium]
MKRLFSYIPSISTLERYILPSLLILFFIQFHYYKFYAQKFGEIAHYTDTSKPNMYEQIQNQHQYAELYQLANKYRNTNVQLFLVTTLQEREYLDYVTTYYQNQNSNQKKTPVYLTELKLMTNYFFYPRVVRSYSLRQFKKLKPIPNSIVIADLDLRYSLPIQSTLVQIPTGPKQYIMNIKKVPKPYYLFNVTQ